MGNVEVSFPLKRIIGRPHINIMIRRNFLSGFIAGAATLALPAPTFAKAVTMTTAKVAPFHYGWACVFARRNNGVSASDIARVFRVSGTEAQGLMDRMVMRGVVTPPGLNGRAQPTRTWQPWEQKTAVAKSDTRNLRDPDQPSIADRFRAVMAHVMQDQTFGYVSSAN